MVKASGEIGMSTWFAVEDGHGDRRYHYAVLDFQAPYLEGLEEFRRMFSIAVGV